MFRTRVLPDSNIMPLKHFTAQKTAGIFLENKTFPEYTEFIKHSQRRERKYLHHLLNITYRMRASRCLAVRKHHINASKTICGQYLHQRPILLYIWLKMKIKRDTFAITAWKFEELMPTTPAATPSIKRVVTWYFWMVRCIERRHLPLPHRTYLKICGWCNTLSHFTLKRTQHYSFTVRKNRYSSQNNYRTTYFAKTHFFCFAIIDDITLLLLFRIFDASKFSSNSFPLQRC